MKKTLFSFTNQSEMVIYIDIEPWSFGYSLKKSDILEIDFSGHSDVCPDNLSDIFEFSFQKEGAYLLINSTYSTEIDVRINGKVV